MKKQQEQQVTLQLTEDGSHTLYNNQVGECYHSVHGAKQESEHIFIEAALRYCPKRDIKLFEVGFGTGLNAWLTLQESAATGRRIAYTTVELYPVMPEVYQHLNYATKEDELLFRKLHGCEWGEIVKIIDGFTLNKLKQSLLETTFSETFDVIYFDAFSPEKQPELWSQEVFNKLYAVTASGGVLTTYCAKGVVRRALIQAGYEVERIPGPPGKRHILRAVRH